MTNQEKDLLEVLEITQTRVAKLECHLLAQRDSIRSLNDDKEILLQTLMSLRNEARGFLSQANEQDHGYTNIQCLQNRIDDASMVIDALKEGK